MKIKQDNKYYKKALKRESEFWEGTNTIYNNEAIEVVEYEQLNRFGDSKIDFINFYRNLGKFNNVLSIGSGDGTFEFKLMKEGIIGNITFIDISKKAVEKLNFKAKELGFESRVKTIITDLNFIKLEENQYDFICCLNVLHHVINLEECLFELNKSLKNNGILLIDDYIGEKKMQWESIKLKFMDFFNEFIFKKYSVKLDKIIKTNPKVLTNNCPFECIRSDELYNIINYYNGDKIIKESLYGIIFNFYSFLGKNINSKILNDLLIFENKLKDLNIFKPTRIFGLYNKSQKPILQTNSWNNKEVKDNIGLSLINEKFLLKIGELLKTKNYKLYKFMKKIYFLIRK